MVAPKSVASFMGSPMGNCRNFPTTYFRVIDCALDKALSPWIKPSSLGALDRGQCPVGQLSDAQASPWPLPLCAHAAYIATNLY